MTLEDTLRELEASEIWRPIVCKCYGLTNDQFFIAFNEFRNKCLVACEEKTEGGLKRYFANWFPLNKDRIFKLSKHEQRQTEQDKRDAIYAIANNHLNGSANTER